VSEPQPPDPAGDSRARKHAAWILSALAVAAGVMAAIFFGFGSSSGHSHGAAGPTIVDGTTTSAPATGGASGSPAVRTSTSASSTPNSPTAPHTSGSSTPAPHSCPTTAPCILAGDVGSVVKAVNAFRTGHGLKTVVGAVSPTVQKCALQQGDGPSCPQAYFWEPVSAPDGGAVVQKISSKATGSQWLLDPAMTTVNVGWAYAPSPGGAGQYECAVVKNG
jgi:hypothetical protein